MEVPRRAGDNSCFTCFFFGLDDVQLPMNIMADTREISFKVTMTCGGCSGAVTKILEKVDGVSNIRCSIPDQRVVVTATPQVDPQDLLAKLQVWAEAAEKTVELEG